MNARRTLAWLLGHLCMRSAHMSYTPWSEWWYEHVCRAQGRLVDDEGGWPY